MTNKKFKLAAMSMALTACVAAQPMIANAADDMDAADVQKDPAPEQLQNAESGVQNESSAETKEEKKEDAPVNKEAPVEDQDPAFGPNVDSSNVEIDYKEPETSPDDEKTTITKGDVIDTSKKDEEQPESEGKDGAESESESEDKSETGEKQDDPGKIGDAVKKETETDSGTEITPSTDPDDVLGKTEDGDTIIKGTETSTSTGTGEAESKTDTSTTTKGDKICLEDELGEDFNKLNWKTDKDTKLNGYDVSGVEESEDKNSKELTLTKTDETTGRMSAEEIAKLLDADKADESVDADGNKTYTLTRTEDVLDADGNKIGTRTTSYEVTGDSVKTTTKTTLTIRMEKTTVEDGVDLPTTEIELPDIKDKETGNTLLTSEELNELLKDKTPGEDGTYTATVEDGDKTYEYIIKPSVGEGTALTDEQLAERLKDNADYSYKNGKFYYKGAELSDVQISAVRKTLSYDVTVTEITKKPSQVEGDGTISDAQQKADAEAKLEAVKNALNTAAGKYGINLTDEELANIDVVNGGTLTVEREGKKYTFAYEGATVTSKEDVIVGADDDKENVKDTTVTGTAYVTGGSKSWSETTKVDGSNSSVLGSDYTKLPDGMKSDEGTTIEKDSDGRIISFVSGGVKYEFTYTKGTELTEDEKKALEKAGISLDKIDADLTLVNWKSTKVTTSESDSNTILSDIEDVIKADEDNTTYTITVDGKTYSGLTKSADGKTYTKTEGSKTTTITVSNNDLDVDAVKTKLANKYGIADKTDIKLDKDETGAFATWKNADGSVVKVRYSDSFAQSFTVTESVKEESNANATTEAQLSDKVMEKVNSLEKGDKLILTGKDDVTYTIIRKEDGTFTISDGTTLKDAVSSAVIKTEVTEIIKKVASNYIKYGELSGKDIWDLLDIQQGFGDGKGNPYAGESGYDSYWPEKGYENIYTKKDGTSYGESISPTTEFDSMNLDADVTIEDEDGNKIDGILLSSGLIFQYGHKEEIAGYVEKDKYPDESYNNYDKKYNNKWTSTDASYDKDKLHTTTTVNTATLDKNLASANGTIWNAAEGRYESTDKLIYSCGSDDHFDGKGFYKISGQVAYGKAGTYSDIGEAQAKLAELQGDDTKKPTIVPVPTSDGKIQYVVYENVTQLNAIGYMTASANTNATSNSADSRWNSWSKSYWTPGCGTPYNGSSTPGGYDLRIQGLKLVNGQVQGNYGVNYSLGMTTIKNSTTSGTNNTLTIDNCTTTTTENKSGNDRFGSYTATYTQSYAWAKDSESEVKGESTRSYRTFTQLLKEFFHGTGETTQDEAGRFSYTYRTEDEVYTEAVSKTEESTTVAHVDYNYTTVTTTDTVVIIPAEDGDEDPIPPTTPELPPVQDATPDAPVTPEAPVLPPVQDATPDAPVLPTNVILPAVQDAHALPQTGVNWLTAIGLALGGFSLMVGGAWASLTGKNAKH